MTTHLTLAHPWHELSRITRDGDPVPIEIKAAADFDGIGVLATWARQDDGSWRVRAVDEEAGDDVTDFGEEECVPSEPPASIDLHPSDCQSCSEGANPCATHTKDWRYWQARALDAESERDEARIRRTERDDATARLATLLSSSESPLPENIRDRVVAGLFAQDEAGRLLLELATEWSQQTPALRDVLATQEKHREVWATNYTEPATKDDLGHDGEDGDLAKGAVYLAMEKPKAGWYHGWMVDLRRSLPTERERLVMAAALLLAEIERLDRAAGGK